MEKYIKGIDSYGNTYNSVELSRKTFNDIFHFTSPYVLFICPLYNKNSI